MVVQTFVDKLCSRFSIKDIGVLSYFLGVEALPNPIAPRYPYKA